MGSEAKDRRLEPRYNLYIFKNLQSLVGEKNGSKVTIRGPEPPYKLYTFICIREIIQKSTNFQKILRTLVQTFFWHPTS